MNRLLPPLPLLLWDTPPALDQVLAQEGVAFVRVRDPHPLSFEAGRFVIYDGRRVSKAVVRATLSPGHVALNVDRFRTGGVDPFQALLSTRSTRATWQVGDYRLTERIARPCRRRLRKGIVDRLRQAVATAGGVWARLAPYPYPYRSAFNFRADLDEPVPSDYARFARARRPLEDCCTHFVSTRAYGASPAVLHDLSRFDTQSHGHHHVVYRDPEANRRNLQRAHRILSDSGIEPVGFAAPHGRWNAGLDAVLEELGYLYSSDFQIGYDDLPFYPWRGGRFSTVLQVPIHPVCEGLFLDAGATDGQAITEHLLGVLRAKVAAGEPAFLYGHPERRLARFPEVLHALHGETAGYPLLWRVTLTEFARWWLWRDARRWSLVPKADGRLEVQFEDWDARYPLGLEIVRGEHVSSVPVSGPRLTLRGDDLAYERRRVRVDLPEPKPEPWSPSLKAALRSALDWETVTPLEELPAHTWTARLKKGLRWWRRGRRAETGS